MHLWKTTGTLLRNEQGGNVPENAERKLTPADIDAIVEQLEARVIARFQTNIGRGMISLVSTWAIRAVVVIAVYGAGSSGLLKKLMGN
jgi:hypothetical protein